MEVIFDIAKNKGKLLPLSMASEETLRGHLMMTFMASSLLKLMGDKLKGTGLITDEMFMNLCPLPAPLLFEFRSNSR